MSVIQQREGFSGLLIILAGCLLLLLFSVSPVTAQNDTTEITADGTLFIQGSIRRVSPEDNKIIVKLPKAGRVHILVTPQVDFVGMSSLADLQRGQRVKVWYNPVGEENRAVKVELMPDLGC